MNPIAGFLAAIVVGLIAFFGIKKMFNHFKKWIKKGGKL
jgi:hypothetical protein